jgi:tripartite-type tricarboxylate transporter receptor subunit TctC
LSLFVHAGFAIAGLVIAGAACGQNFPSKPVRVVTGEVGGATDITARLIGPGLTEALGQQVLVDNRGGGSGAIAALTVSRASPDGHTLLFYASALWIVPLMQEVAWDPVKDFSPITLVASAPNILVVHPSLPVKSLGELIALARARPGALNYASGGSGGSPHLAAELFKSMARVDIVRVSYKGGGPAVNDLIAGQVQLMFGSAGSVTPHVRSGRLRPLAVTSLQPSPLAPGLPTVASFGLPGFVTLGHFALFAPAGTPASVIGRVQQEIARVIARPLVKEKLLSSGLEPAGGTPEALAALVKSEIAMWGKVLSKGPAPRAEQQ